jgi:DedD protein
VDDRLKQRLVGATVIISLGVIFLPAILDGGRYMEFETIRIEIPPQPEVDFSSTIAPLAPAEVRLPENTNIAGPPDLDAIEAQGREPILDEELSELIKPIEAPEEIVSNKGVKVSKPEPETASKATDKAPSPVTPKKPGKAKVIAKTTPPSLPLPAPSSVNAWVVQVGSFSKRESAIDLRDKIRKQGFAAFVESFDKNGAAAHRVRVGPETTRGRSEQTLAALKEKMKLGGIVVTYP